MQLGLLFCHFLGPAKACMELISRRRRRCWIDAANVFSLRIFVSVLLFQDDEYLVPVSRPLMRKVEDEVERADELTHTHTHTQSDVLLFPSGGGGFELYSSEFSELF